MAFKATRKPTTTSRTRTTKSSTPKAEEAPVVEVTPPADMPTPVVPVSSLSVDDFIGNPLEKIELPTPVAPVAPIRELKPTPPPIEKPYSPPAPMTPPPEPYVQNRGSYDRGNGGNSGGYGYRERRFNNGNNNNNNNGGNFRRPMGIRRDFSPGESYGQDVITVPTETVKGLLDIMPEGHGFLRPKFTPSDKDVYISQSQIRRFLLRNGDMVEGQARSPKDNERYWGLLKVEKIDERPAEEMEKRPKFEDLTPVYPNKAVKLETAQAPLSTRIIDLFAPIGFGQRGLIVSPPKAGKTTIIKELAAGISQNFPNVHLMAALIGERPEEVTDITRGVKGEVLASNFDESPQEQTRIAEVALDRAKRLVEMGKDVVILLDSITRLARAYNLVVNPSGRTLSGGFDPAALYPAKRFLGAARCVEILLPDGTVGQGGSLTVIGTALVETGSRMDDLIYEEFKGTGNMELHLSRSLQERRVFPAIDIVKSGTRHDELLLGEDRMKKVTTLRHMLSILSDEERTVMLIDRMSKTKSNDEFLETLTTSAA